MAWIVGLHYFDNYLYSQKPPFLNLSFHHDVVFMHSWDWTLAEITFHLFTIRFELQGFKICGGRELAGHRLSC